MQEIIEIQKKAKREIFSIIIEKFKEDKKEIENNYNMGLITFEEYLNQLNGTILLRLSNLEEYEIDQFEILN